MSPRGGLLWEDQTYNDRTVLLAAPETFDPSRPGHIVVFFHGNNATLERDVIARQQIVRQLANSGLNAVLSPRSPMTLPIPALEESGRRTVSPLSSTRPRASSATSTRTRAEPSAGCRSSWWLIAAAICLPSIR